MFRLHSDAAATVGFAGNAFKQHQIFPPAANPEASGNKNSSEVPRQYLLPPPAPKPSFNLTLAITTGKKDFAEHAPTDVYTGLTSRSDCEV